MYKSERRAFFLLIVLSVIIIVTIINVIYTFYYERDLYFAVPNTTMNGFNVSFKTSLPIKYKTDCEDWCNQEPSCQAYETTNTSFCSLKTFNGGKLSDKQGSTVFLKQTADISPMLGGSFSSLYNETTLINDPDIAVSYYLSPIDCMKQCLLTPSCTGFVMTTSLHSSPYQCFLKSSALENTSSASYSMMIPLNLPQSYVYPTSSDS